MKHVNLVLACAAAGIAASPFIAYRFRPPDLPLISSPEAWLHSALMGGDTLHRIGWYALALGALGLAVGFVTKLLVESIENLLPLRTPIAGAILGALTFATGLFIWKNWPWQDDKPITWPTLHCDDQPFCVAYIAAAIVGAILVEKVNQRDRNGGTKPTSFGAVLCLAMALGLLAGGGICGCFAGAFFGSPLVGLTIGVGVMLVIVTPLLADSYSAYFWSSSK
jgi:hypothetical protein